jgi:hypothetical protein
VPRIEDLFQRLLAYMVVSKLDLRSGYHQIANNAKIAAPLTDLLGSKLRQWSASQDQAFQALKAALTSAPILTFPDSTKPFVVGTDAADFAIGAVLQHDHGKGLQPIVFLSRKLTARQVKYPSARTRALCHHRSPSCLATPPPRCLTVQVLTNYVTMKFFTTQPKLSPCQVRLLVPIANFDLTISYKPCKDNIVPDALSRRPDLKLLLFSAGLHDDIDAYVRLCRHCYRCTSLMHSLGCFRQPSHCHCSLLKRWPLIG